MDETPRAESDPRDLLEVRWAPRVEPAAIRRLNETDPLGIVDVERAGDER
jgi:hypothetical protein